jgi:hypothetical protein
MKQSAWSYESVKGNDLQVSIVHGRCLDSIHCFVMIILSEQNLCNNRLDQKRGERERKLKRHEKDTHSRVHKKCAYHRHYRLEYLSR